MKSIFFLMLGVAVLAIGSAFAMDDPNDSSVRVLVSKFSENQEKKPIKMIIAQITDTHILPPGQDWLEIPETKVNERLIGVVEHLNALLPRPDVLLLTGNTIEIGGRWEDFR